jgi:hypothetical protein
MFGRESRGRRKEMSAQQGVRAEAMSIVEEPAIAVPLRILKMVLVHGDIEELEDWLLVHNPEFIARMRRARENDLAGRSITWEQVKQELGIE